MKLFKDCWVALLDLFNAVTLTSTDGSAQHSLGFGDWPGFRPGKPQFPFPSKPKPTLTPIRKPVFTPPSRGEDSDNGILCDYTAMGAGWGSCSTADDRGCWLKGPNGQRYDINTDYENKYPKGVTRKVYYSRSCDLVKGTVTDISQYHLDVVNMTIDADGVPNKWGKVFNYTYPGPWLREFIPIVLI